MTEDEVLTIIQKYNENSQYTVGPFQYHSHTGVGVDGPQISFNSLVGRTMVVNYTLFGTQAATAGNYSTFFIVPAPMVVQKIQEVHVTAGSDVGAVTLNVEKLTGTTAPGGGTNILSTAINLKGTANTVNTGTLTNTLSTKQLATGNRLALVLSGTPTAVANVTVQITLSY